ncbi:hypothetical protein [Streptosporangium sandarakinum]|uniref:Uncharacterized protein n=1 Tax=Streptosporangium sandarakinum TaxID=1260955 RepID=A0A852V0Z4_9ACTN|nr:hypothetical protein [Streptosporangium sandarakinum]NYF41830.1 hypothetical protein [Streptosporangium sandarakinum]
MAAGQPAAIDVPGLLAGHLRNAPNATIRDALREGGLSALAGMPPTAQPG